MGSSRWYKHRFDKFDMSTSDSDKVLCGPENGITVGYTPKSPLLKKTLDEYKIDRIPWSVFRRQSLPGWLAK